MEGSFLRFGGRPFLFRIGGTWFGFAGASSYWGVLVFRVWLCVKLLGESSFQGLPVHEAIGDSTFKGLPVRQAIAGFYCCWGACRAAAASAAAAVAGAGAHIS